jgi:hypothetical protein
MKIKNTLALGLIVYTAVMVMDQNAEAKEWIGHQAATENLLWEQIRSTDMDIDRSQQKASDLREKVKLVENHIDVQTDLKNDLNAQLEDINENGIIQLGKAYTGDVSTMKIGDMDLTKITRAVATAETGNGRTGSALTHNNPCGLMYSWYEDGVRMRTYHYYDSYMDGFNACSKTLMNSPTWSEKKYRDMTIEEMAALWTGSDREENWINNVTITYKSQL